MTKPRRGKTRGPEMEEGRKREESKKMWKDKSVLAIDLDLKGNCGLINFQFE